MQDSFVSEDGCLIDSFVYRVWEEIVVVVDVVLS